MPYHEPLEVVPAPQANTTCLPMPQNFSKKQPEATSGLCSQFSGLLPQVLRDEENQRSVPQAFLCLRITTGYKLEVAQEAF